MPKSAANRRRFHASQRSVEAKATAPKKKTTKKKND